MGGNLGNSKQILVHAFSTTHNGIARELVTDIWVCQAFDPRVPGVGPAPQHKQFKALWDTGATGSCITDRVANELGLVAIGMTRCSHAQGVSDAAKYLVNIGLPNKVQVAAVSVVSAVLDGGIDVIIGMDIITMGDFAITNAGGLTYLTFRMPSCGKICFLAPKPAVILPRKPMPGETARSAPCPCGSGRKYKRCCGAS